ncbi:MAG: PDZ domain-containing protein [Candidatus Cloacimonetes bacterium]|nr:PDZ domain-containing protein [Candidatus Cloacimonadota bacterium]
MKKICLIVMSLMALLFLQAKEVAFLGVETEDIPFNDYVKYGITDGYGIYLNEVTQNSAAEEAGLKKGMVLRKFNDEKIYTRNQMTRMIQNKAIGDKVQITVLENGSERTLKAVLGKNVIYEAKKSAWLGVKLTDQVSAENFPEDYGLEITYLAPDSPAEKAGLKSGDVLLALNNDNLYSVDQLQKILKSCSPDDVVNMICWCDGKKENIKITLGENENIFNIFDGIPGLPDFPDFFEGIQNEIDLGDLYYDWNALGLPGKVHIYSFPDSTGKMLGVIVATPSDENSERKEQPEGVIVKSVIKGTTADEGGIKKGDIILQIEDMKIKVKQDIRKALELIENGKNFQVRILRDGKEEDLQMLMKSADQEMLDKFNITVDDDHIINFFSGEDDDELYYYNWMENDSPDSINADELIIKFPKKGSIGPR